MKYTDDQKVIAPILITMFFLFFTYLIGGGSDGLIPVILYFVLLNNFKTNE